MDTQFWAMRHDTRCMITDRYEDEVEVWFMAHLELKLAFLLAF